MSSSTIIYTKTDEAPALASYSLLPIIRCFGQAADIDFDYADISLAGRIIAHFPEQLSDEQKQPDTLSQLGKMAQTPEANIIKLPNISASIPQLEEAIAELQAHGYQVPDYPSEPKTDEEKDVNARYAKVLGSAVNPVLREGNSDRRVAAPVKAFARKNPHSMGAWEAPFKSHVAHMQDHDFYASEQSHIMDKADDVRIEHVASDGSVTILKESTPLEEGEVIDASFMSAKALRTFFKEQIADAKEKDVMFSLHLKATMMKVSDPIMFGHAVSVFYEDVFKKHAATFDKLGVNPNYGLGSVYQKIQDLPEDQRKEIEADIDAVYEQRPRMAMVNSDKGITNLHVPSDVIIDASMPAHIRTSGKMWGPDGDLEDTKFIIPDRCYATVYDEVFKHCEMHGAFDPATMGNVCNVGLMAKKAEEYGSHDKTFEVPSDGSIRVVDQSGTTLLEHKVDQGDIWRMCQTKDIAIQDWVRLAIKRARDTGATTIFWLDKNRAHDASLLKKVQAYLAQHDTDGLDLSILPPAEACRLSCERARAGKDSVSVTGNVLRDYLTDLFPILELGTSAKMLSIVPLLAGGGLYETGAGGSAPKHVQQFEAEGHLRWDSLGEFLALAVSIADLAEKTGNSKGKVLARALDDATSAFLENNKSPSRKVNELDNRGSHFYLALYWAEALAAQDDDSELNAQFSELAKTLRGNEEKIVEELNAAQGAAQDIGGYYQPDDARAEAAMRPSPTFNDAINGLVKA